MDFLFYCVISFTVLFLSIFVQKKNLITDAVIMSIVSSIYGFFSATLPYDKSDRFYYAMHYSYGIWANAESVNDIMRQNSSEYGYAIFCYLLRCVTNEPETYFFSVSFVSVFCALISIYATKYSFRRSMFFFVCSWYPFLTIYSCRQMLAVGFVCLAFVYYWNNRVKRSILCFFLGCLFHATSFICIFAVLFSRYFNSKGKHIFFLIISIFLSFFALPVMNILIEYIPYLQNKFLGSVTVSNISSMIIGKGIPYFLLHIIVLINYKKFKFANKDLDGLMIIVLFGCVSFLAAMQLFWLYRMSFYCIIPSIFLLNELCINIKKINIDNIFALLIFLSNLAILYREIDLFFTNYL